MTRKIVLTLALLLTFTATVQAHGWRWHNDWRWHHHKAHTHKFVSHYCNITQSPYIGGPQAQVCCKWHPAWADIPDGYGTWDCTITTIPAVASSRRS